MYSILMIKNQASGSLSDDQKHCICSMWLVIDVVTFRLCMIYKSLIGRERSAHVAGKTQSLLLRYVYIKDVERA
jgi:hypothetical protein